MCDDWKAARENNEMGKIRVNFQFDSKIDSFFDTLLMKKLQT